MDIEKIDESWHSFFEENEELINSNLEVYNNDSKRIFPPKKYCFRVFKMPIDYIKVVIVGQDPYHGYGQANGLSFSVNKEEKIPPSLRNIFKELNNEFPEREYNFNHGDISRWFFEEGIFLLNSSLTVEEKKPGSHLDRWQDFTDNCIKYISKENPEASFLLLGNYAKGKSSLIDNKEMIVTGTHPSPMAVNKGGFFNSGIFIKIEDLVGEINWSL